MPKGINQLYIIQMAITFSYAVIFSSLSLFLTRKIGFSAGLAGETIGLFLAFNYALHLLAGYIGGRLLSNRSLILISTVCQILGFAVLGLNSGSTVYIGLCLFLVGCGINVTCYNCILVSRFGDSKEEDSRRKSASFMSYCFMNAGFFLGFTTSGYFESIASYNSIFFIGNIFNFVALSMVLISWKNLKETDTILADLCESNISKKRLKGLIAIIACVPLMLVGFRFPVISNSLVVMLGGLMFSLIYIKARTQLDNLARKNISIFIILSLASIVFWMIYFVGPMSVTLFIKNNTDTTIMGYDIQPQWFNNINASIIICGSPALAYIFRYLGERNINISEFTSFSVAILLISLSFFMLVNGINHAMPNGMTKSSWVVIYYVLQSLGELFIGPVGCAMIGRLAPLGMRGLLMGTFMLSSGIGASISSYFASLMSNPSNNSPILTNNIYHDTFLKLGESGLVMVIILLSVSYFIYASNKRSEIQLKTGT